MLKSDFALIVIDVRIIFSLVIFWYNPPQWLSSTASQTFLMESFTLPYLTNFIHKDNVLFLQWNTSKLNEWIYYKGMGWVVDIFCMIWYQNLNNTTFERDKIKLMNA